MHLIVTNLLLQSYGLPILRKDRSTRKPSRLERSKYLFEFWLLQLFPARSRKYPSSYMIKHQRSSQIGSSYCFATVSCICSTTSHLSLCDCVDLSHKSIFFSSMSRFSSKDCQISLILCYISTLILHNFPCCLTKYRIIILLIMYHSCNISKQK